MAAWRGKAKAKEIKRREKLEAEEARRAERNGKDRGSSPDQFSFAERKVERVDFYRGQESQFDPTTPAE
jgi:pyridoxine/pyridoxamine 5'-phosphate oxidase